MGKKEELCGCRQDKPLVCPVFAFFRTGPLHEEDSRLLHAKKVEMEKREPGTRETSTIGHAETEGTRRQDAKRGYGKGATHWHDPCLHPF